jgi:RNA recognition motif-containing protein
LLIFKVYVGNLDLSCTQDDLLEHFKAKCPGVLNAKIISDPKTKMPKGYGFVEFDKKSETDYAIQQMEGSYLRGKPIKVRESFMKVNNSNSYHPPKEKQPPKKLNPLELQQIYNKRSRNMMTHSLGPAGPMGFVPQLSPAAYQQQYILALQQQQVLFLLTKGLATTNPRRCSSPNFWSSRLATDDVLPSSCEKSSHDAKNRPCADDSSTAACAFSAAADGEVADFSGAVWDGCARWASE